MSNMKGPLSKMMFISLPEHLDRSVGGFRIDPSVKIPIDVPENRDDWTIQDLSWEMIVAGMLKLLAYEPDHADAGYFRGFVLAAKPDIVNELTETAILKARNRDFELSEEIFRALKGLLPDDPRTLMNLALVFEQRADSYESIGNEELQTHYSNLAFETYKTLFALDDVVPEAHLNSGFFFLKLKNFDKAREHFSTFAKLSTDQEKRQEALRIVKEIESQNLLDNLFKEAYDFIRLGREEEGIAKIDKFLVTYPTVWNAWFIKGWGYRRLGNYIEARRAFLKALELGPEQADTLNELAICHMELGELEECKRRLTQALQIDPENVKIISNFGVLALKKEQFEEAARFFRTVLELEPEDPIALRYLEQIEKTT